MKYVLVLISPENGPVLTDSLIDEVLSALPADLVAHAPHWLDLGKACDIGLTKRDATGKVSTTTTSRSSPGELLKHMRQQVIAPAVERLQVDVALLPREHRRKKLLIADMDSTIINQECIDEIADLAGLGDQVARITERAMRGELDFETALRERVLMLQDLDASILQEVYLERISVMSGARVLVQTMKAHGAFCALVSGGFDYFTKRIAASVGFDVDQANKLAMAQNQLSGMVLEPILGRQAKLDALLKYAAEQDVAAPETLAVGDGANDLAMIKAAGLGVAYRAKPIVASEADAAIIHGDLTALLYLQGYKRVEFASI